LPGLPLRTVSVSGTYWDVAVVVWVKTDYSLPMPAGLVV
jgi:hypothetical protein